MSDDLEDRVRRTLARQAHGVTSSMDYESVVRRTKSQRRPRPRRWGRVASVAAAVAVIATAIVIGTGLRKTQNTEAGPSAAPSSATAILSSTSDTAASTASSNSPTSTSEQPVRSTSSASTSSTATATGRVLSASQGFPSSGQAPITMFTRYPVDESITERSVYVGWAPSGDVLVVTMFGGNCTPSVKKVLRTGTDEVTLLLSDDPEFIGHGQPPDRMCTANLSGYTTIIEPPTGITPAKSIVVVVNAAHHRLPSR